MRRNKILSQTLSFQKDRKNTGSFWFLSETQWTNCQISLEHKPKNQSLAPIKSVTYHPVKSCCNEALLLALVVGDHSCISFYVLIIPYCSLQSSHHHAIFLLGFWSQTRSAGWKMPRFHHKHPFLETGKVSLKSHVLSSRAHYCSDLPGSFLNISELTVFFLFNLYFFAHILDSWSMDSSNSD